MIPLLLLLALVSSACKMRFDTALTVNADESGTFAIEMSFDEEFRALSEEGGGDGLGDLTTGFEDAPAGWGISGGVSSDIENQPGYEGATVTIRVTVGTACELFQPVIERMTELWRQVHAEDHAIVEGLQAGRASPVLDDGGVLSPVWESCIEAFYGELVDAMADR